MFSKLTHYQIFTATNWKIHLKELTCLSPICQPPLSSAFYRRARGLACCRGHIQGRACRQIRQSPALSSACARWRTCRRRDPSAPGSDKMRQITYCDDCDKWLIATNRLCDKSFIATLLIVTNIFPYLPRRSPSREVVNDDPVVGTQAGGGSSAWKSEMS